ncbi:hypothetical protein Tco_1122476 [Tanacetum coccineum]|uniref:Uncharacterized protein n=1 Tax=Tanacetum coccineum TaxID=301880 RepID=A0ABQ5J143_9ASTR
MDDPNITMEEYIRLEKEKAQRHGRTFNWQTATFGKVKNYDDEDGCFIDFETEFPAINIAPLPHRDLRHPWLRYHVDGYDEGIVHRFGSEVEDGVYWGRGAAGICESCLEEIVLDLSAVSLPVPSGVSRYLQDK